MRDNVRQFKKKGKITVEVVDSEGQSTGETIEADYVALSIETYEERVVLHEVAHLFGAIDLYMHKKELKAEYS